MKQANSYNRRPTAIARSGYVSSLLVGLSVLMLQIVDARQATAALLCGQASHCGTAESKASVRAFLQQRCPCTSFTQPKAYARCAKSAMKAAGGALQVAVSKPCRKEILTEAKNSVCGHAGFALCTKTNGSQKTFCAAVKSGKCRDATCEVLTSCGEICDAGGECLLPPGSSTTTTTTVTATVTQTNSTSTTVTSTTGTTTTTGASSTNPTSTTTSPTTSTTTTPGSTTTTIPPSELLRLVISGTPDGVAANEDLFYQVTVINRGAVPVANVTATIQIPVGSSGGGCLMDGAGLVQGYACNAGANYTWTIGTLGAGESRTFRPSVHLTSSSLPAQIVTNASVSAGVVQAAAGQLVTAVTSTPVFALRVTDASDPGVVPGATITYTITFGNRSAGARLNTTLTAAVPPGTTLGTISDGGMAAAGVITWPIGTLSAGATGQRSFTVTIDALGADESGYREADVELHDDAIPQAAARASAVTIVRPTPRLGLEVTATPSPVQLGGIVSYQLTVTNHGVTPLTTVTVRLKLPNASSGGGCLMDGGTLAEGYACNPAAIYTWSLGTLAAGASRTILPSVTISSAASVAGAVLFTQAQVTADGGENARGDVATPVETLPAFTLRVVDSPDPAVVPGATITYTLTFGNRSGTSRLDTNLTATVPPGTTLGTISDGGTATAGVITWPLGTLNAGTTNQRSFTVTVDDLGTAEPGFRKTIAELDDDGVPQATAHASAVTVVQPATALGLAMTATPSPVQVGGVVFYQLTVTNHGQTPLTTATVRLKLPVGSSGGGCLVDGGTLAEGYACDSATVYTWTLGTLAAGASRTILPSVTISSAANLAGFVLLTQAQVTADGGYNARADVATPVETLPAFTLRVADTTDPSLLPGATTTYTLTFGNRSANARLGTVLTATVPPGTTLGTISDGGTAADGIITWPLGTIGAGGGGLRSFTATVADLGSAEPGFRQTIAELRDGGTPQATSHASAVTVVDPAPALTLAVVADPDPLVTGGAVSYQLKVTNVSNAALTGVELRLKLPSGSSGGGCQADGGTLTEGYACNPGAVYAWSLGTLAAGTTQTRTPLVDTSTGLAGFVLFAEGRVVADGGASARGDVVTRLTN